MDEEAEEVNSHEASNGLIDLLSKEQNFSTADELAKKMNLSSKSIYRLITRINNSEKSKGNDYLIIAERGKGIRLNNSVNKNIASIEDPINRLTPFSRRNQVLMELLYNSPKEIRISRLYDKYYVSDSVISNDEIYMNNWLSKFCLKIKRFQRTMSVIGDEKAIRQAISFLFSLSGNHDLNGLFVKDSKAYKKQDSDFVYCQIQKIEKELGTVIPHPYDINIFSHILILINRYRKVGNKKINGLGTLNEEETEFVLMHEKIYHIAKEISKNIESYIGKKLLDADSYYIFEYLLSSRTVSPDTVPINTDRKVITIADDYLDLVSKFLGRKKDFTDIRNDLINHIKPMLNRIKYSLNVKNSLLKQIKSEYYEVFAAVQEATKIIEKKERIPEISDDEVGFLALYFAQSLERTLPRIRVLIMCTTGVGTAELLKVKVARSFANLDIVSVVSEREFRQIRSPDIDLVISTIPISDSKIPLVVVSAIFNNSDKQIVSDEVEKIERKKVSIY
ncbi:putative Transcription antiterminator, BglG family [Oenococcus oeni]|nr:hypothetical protein AX764_05940 [Oenococcus oeni]SYW02848.1 putative Transcription antiterminator, BglG family [Oenococcus oeni]SYW03455.1 putative Transcription antiterminator, BglG family [Oenococcus oeni]SYW19200.1 putative Transcription antiterminator, BglG family [Oenococcus oeni]VDC14958.1 putative Transcription antiterminator, BglG family [Oenococcus oeni]